MNKHKKYVFMALMGIVWLIATLILRNGKFLTTDSSSLSGFLAAQFIFIPFLIGFIVLVFQDRWLGIFLLVFWFGIMLSVFMIKFSILIIMGSAITLIYYWCKTIILSKRISYYILGVALILIILIPTLGAAGLINTTRPPIIKYSLLLILTSSLTYSIIESTKGHKTYLISAIFFFLFFIIHVFTNIALDNEWFNITNELFIAFPFLGILSLSLVIIMLPSKKYFYLSRVVAIVYFYLSISLLVSIIDISLYK